MTITTRKYNYVYVTYEADGKRGYIGSRGSHVPPEEDPYMGSHNDKTYNPSIKQILAVFDTREEAFEYEDKLLKFYNAIESDFLVNKHIGFTFEVVRGEECYNSKLTEELVKEIYIRVWSGESRRSIIEDMKDVDVTVASIADIKRGRTWSYLTKDIDLEYELTKRGLKKKTDINSGKLTKEQVKELYIRIWSGETYSFLSREYGITQGALAHIKCGRSWSYITKDIDLEYELTKRGLSNKREGYNPSIQKISDEDAKEVYIKAWSGENYNKIAKEYGISKSLVYSIKSGLVKKRITKNIEIPGNK